jgi:hypothetical protein
VLFTDRMETVLIQAIVGSNMGTICPLVPAARGPGAVSHANVCTLKIRIFPGRARYWALSFFGEAQKEDFTRRIVCIFAEVMLFLATAVSSKEEEYKRDKR